MAQRRRRAAETKRRFISRKRLAAGAIALLCTASVTTGLQLFAGASSNLPDSIHGHLEFDYNPTNRVLNRADWNTFITSNAAQGRPWNSNGQGGSSAAAYSPNEDAEYDLPGQVSQQHGAIVLSATQSPTNGFIDDSPTVFPFASGVLSTYGKFEFTGGYLQVRAKMPAAPGMWPGIWMLPGPGASHGDDYEIDLFEGGADNGGRGTSSRDMFAWHLHTPAGTFGTDTNSGVNLTSKFNTYGLLWIPGTSITWYLNGKIIGILTSAQAPIPNEPMELIMSLQVATSAASNWHTVYNSSDPQVSQMLISSVKVFS